MNDTKACDGKPKEFWIWHNRTHPNGHIVPDVFKRGGFLAIEKSAYDAQAARIEELEKALEVTDNFLRNQMEKFAKVEKKLGLAVNALERIEYDDPDTQRIASDALEEIRNEDK